MSFWSKIKKILCWIPFLWKMDDGSWTSLYYINIKQMNDMQVEILKYSDLFPDGVDFCFQIEEARNNLKHAIEEKDIEIAERHSNRAFEIIKQNSMNWYI